MRLRNIKNASEIIKESEYFIDKKEDFKGNFKSLFKNNQPLHIEIGMGKGNYIINMAKKYPNINFIGIEKYSSVIVKAIKKLEEEEKLDNLKIMELDANFINEIFYKEISVIYLNFSDPWPKNRHANRRLSSHIFLELYKDIFIKEQRVIMKTDNRNLFEYSVCSLSSFGYVLENISCDLHNSDCKDNVMTEYEEKFVKENKNIYMLVAYIN